MFFTFFQALFHDFVAEESGDEDDGACLQRQISELEKERSQADAERASFEYQRLKAVEVQDDCQREMDVYCLQQAFIVCSSRSCTHLDA